MDNNGRFSSVNEKIVKATDSADSFGEYNTRTKLVLIRPYNYCVFVDLHRSPGVESRTYCTVCRLLSKPSNRHLFNADVIRKMTETKYRSLPSV